MYPLSPSAFPKKKKKNVQRPGPSLSSSTVNHSFCGYAIQTGRHLGFVFCLIYYKITQDIFNRASESILGNPQKLAESSHPQQPGYIWLNLHLLSLGRKFSTSARCESKHADIDLGQAGEPQQNMGPANPRAFPSWGESRRDPTHHWLSELKIQTTMEIIREKWLY